MLLGLTSVAGDRCPLWLRPCHHHFIHLCKLHQLAHCTSGLQGALGGNKQKRTESDFITVEDIVKHHWQEFGRSAMQMLPGWAGAQRPLLHFPCVPEAGASHLSSTQTWPCHSCSWPALCGLRTGQA